MPQVDMSQTMTPCIDSVLDSICTPTIDWGQESDLAVFFSNGYTQNDSMQTEAAPSAVNQTTFRISPESHLSTLPPRMIKSLRVEDVCSCMDIVGVEKTIKASLEQSNDNGKVERAIGLAVRIMLKRSPLVEGLSSIMVRFHTPSLVLNFLLQKVEHFGISTSTLYD
jgi:hypothetical protein